MTFHVAALQERLKEWKLKVKKNLMAGGKRNNTPTKRIQAEVPSADYNWTPQSGGMSTQTGEVLFTG